MATVYNAAANKSSNDSFLSSLLAMQLFPRSGINSKEPEKVFFIEWTSSIDFFTHSDDLKIHTSEGTSKEGFTVKNVPLNKGTHIINVDCMSAGTQSVDQRKKSSETFAIGTSDGKCLIMHKSGRAERIIEAHKGAVLNARWNHDGTSLLTSGEDGLLKIWSRSGMLRSTHAQADSPIYAAVWSPFSTGVLYSAGKVMTIQPFAANTKTLQWKAHESVVLSVAWCPSNGLIASGSEDCHFKIWDALGQLLYDSAPRLHPVAAVTWSPDGSHCAFATFSSVCVTSAYGNDMIETSMEGDGVTALAWSPDGSQLAAGNSTGRLQIFHLIQSDVSWSHYHVSVRTPNAVELHDDLNETTETLEFKDDALLVSFAFGHLVVVSQTHIFVHRENTKSGWASSVVAVELREKCPQFVQQADKYLLVMDGGVVYVFGYDGTLLGTPKISGQRLMSPSLMTSRLISIAKEVLAVRSPLDPRSVLCLHYRTGKALYGGDKPAVIHGSHVTAIKLDPCSATGDHQLLAFVDSTRDLHLLALPAGLNKIRTPLKISGGVTSFCWNSDCSMLALIREEEELLVVPYPPAVPGDPSLLDKFTIRQNIREYGKHVEIRGFSGHSVELGRSDGLNFRLYLSPYPSQLQTYVTNGRWESAQRLCSSIKMEVLWVCLAAMAVHYKQLDAAQVAFAALRDADKILYIDAIKKMNNVAMIKAETALLQNGRAEAEAILLQAGLPLKAIMLNLQLFQFDKALELAIKHDSNIDVVIAYRRKYLEQFGWPETVPRFIEYAKKVEIDWDAIEEKLVED